MSQINKLKFAKSPYLLQHAENPINWYPWGQEALDQAKNEDKLIFLSIGYSTCRWCHNMNRDAFQDEEVGHLLNENFISIKVDREERPDLDQVYISFAEALTGNAGWPLTLILTPEEKPIFAGTYFHKETRAGRIGLIDLLNEVKDAWESKRERLVSESNRILSEVAPIYENREQEELDRDLLARTRKELRDNFDEKYGGFYDGPKFPLPQNILFCLEYGQKINDEKVLEMAWETLDNIYKGGIFDHVGFGFYRYSVDEKWLVPHFEKMLYDNALLALAYIRAYEKTKNPIYKEVTEKIFEFVIRDLGSGDGGFYSALDAETEGEEGKFYVFSREEIIEELGEEYGQFYCDFYGISGEGNFKGKNIPNLIGKDLKNINKQDWAKLEGLRDRVYQFREKRTKPHRDEKILTSWNGLFIGALAYGGKVLGNDIYLNHGKRAADFILASSIDEEGRLLSTHMGGESYNYGFLEDYAYLTFGLLALYQATEDEGYLKISRNLINEMLDLFWDKENGGLFYYSNISQKLILRPKDIYDGSTPSGNGLALINLALLYNYSGDEDLLKKVQGLLGVFAHNINSNPTAHIYSILALMLLEK